MYQLIRKPFYQLKMIEDDTELLEANKAPLSLTIMRTILRLKSLVAILRTEENG